MSRFEGKFTAAGEASLTALDFAELATSRPEESRQQAIARCLAAEEGWQDALRELRGAFAADAARPSRLSGRQAE